MKKLLIADDEEATVESIQNMLNPYYSVNTATTGIEILELCEEHDFEGLIIDIEFGPGMSGLDVATTIRENNKKIKILVFSGLEYSDEIRQQVVDIGAVFCEKPISLQFITKTFG